MAFSSQLRFTDHRSGPGPHVLSNSHIDGQRQRLTLRGDAVIRKAFELTLARFRAVFASLSSAELASLMTLLQRVRESFAAPP
jgi:hypothetical protein